VEQLAHQWYALCCKPRKERMIWQQLLSRGYDVFYPRILIRTRNGKRLIVKPFFPGYLFVNLDVEVESASKFQWMEHATGLVCVDGKPFHIPDGMIEAMQNRLFEINTAIRTPASQGDGTISSEKPEEGLTIRDLAEDICADEEWSYALVEMLTKFTTTVEKGIC
jgi:transcription antitermination factor NusG